MTARKDGVAVALRVTPGAARNRVVGPVPVADGRAGDTELKVLVTAAPEGGKANRAVIDMLAREWRLPRRSMRIAAGAANRRKTLHISGDPHMLAAALADSLATRLGDAP